MALLFMDGFDHYGTDIKELGSAGYNFGPFASTYISIANSIARTGLHGIRLQGNNTGDSALLRRPFNQGSRSKIGVAMALYLENLADTNYRYQLPSFRDTANNIIATVTLDTTGRLLVTGAAASTAGTHVTDVPVIVPKAWQHLECFLDTTSGGFEARVDGVTVLTVTGMSLGNANPVAQIMIGFDPRLGTSSNWYFHIDDLYAWDTTGDYNNDFLGDKKVFYIKADQDKSPQDWLPTGAATGAAAIGTDAPNDATYITATPDSVPATSKFSLSTLDPRIAAIAAVQTYTRMKKDDAGAANVKVSLESNSQLDSGADRPITTKYTYWQDVFEKDPNTGAAWTPQGLQDANLVIERTA